MLPLTTGRHGRFERIYLPSYLRFISPNLGCLNAVRSFQTLTTTVFTSRHPARLECPHRCENPRLHIMQDCEAFSCLYSVVVSVIYRGVPKWVCYSVKTFLLTELATWHQQLPQFTDCQFWTLNVGGSATTLTYVVGLCREIFALSTTVVIIGTKCFNSRKLKFVPITY
jgi:hypothetical protein